MPNNIVFTDDDQYGFSVRLSDAADQPEGIDVVPFVDGEMLDRDATVALLARLPKLEEESDDAQAFRRPVASRPPPQSGEEVSLPFPAPEGPEPPPTDTGPLAVCRFAPEGEVLLARRLSITFSQPMTALTAHDNPLLAPAAAIEPEPPGRWRMLGTKTLVYEPDDRFPMATTYRVTVPAGTRSVTGGMLADTQTFTFSTPALGLVASYPNEQIVINIAPVFVLRFDQRIDRESLLPHVTLLGAGGLRLATEADLERDPAAKAFYERSEPDRVIALKPVQPLRKATTYSMTVKAGAPAAEGPRTTEHSQSYRVRTYEPLNLENYGCRWNRDCTPDNDWRLEFNNPIDPALFDPDSFTIKPDLPNRVLEVHGSSIMISGLRSGHTDYVVTIPADLTDVFGQRLGCDETVTFEVGKATPLLIGPPEFMVVLEPGGGCTLTVYARNLHSLNVRVWKVRPEDWSAMVNYRAERSGCEPFAPAVGLLVANTTVFVTERADTIVDVPIGLKPWLDSDLGHLIVHIEPTEQPPEPWERMEVLVWVQGTRLAIHAAVDDQSLLAWVSNLADGMPLSDAEVGFLDGPKARTTLDGTTTLMLDRDCDVLDLLIAREGRDVAFLPLPQRSLFPWHGWVRRDRSDELLWYVFDDRGLYKPCETALIKGWLRRRTRGAEGDITAAPASVRDLRWTLYDPRGNELAGGETALHGLGGFSVDVNLPADMNLGRARLELEALQADCVSRLSYTHFLRVEEFRRLEYTMSVAHYGGSQVIGEPAVFTATARYFAGGGLAGSRITWSVDVGSGYYRPPDQDEYSFGTWSPWWRSVEPDGESRAIASHDGITDGAGSHRVRIDVRSPGLRRPLSVRAEATVVDVSRQVWTADSKLLLHPSARYVGLRAARTFVDAGSAIEIEGVVVAIDGRVVAGASAEVVLLRRQGHWRAGCWTEEEIEEGRCTLEPSGEGPGTCTFHPKESGSYRLLATVVDEHGRHNESELLVWVAGDRVARRSGVVLQDVELIPGGRDYGPGDLAEVLVRLPFAPAEVLLTVRRDGLFSSERRTVPDGWFVYKLPLEDKHVPDVTIHVEAVGAVLRLDDDAEPRRDVTRQPAYASGSLQVKVAPTKRRLEVCAAPALDALEPGGSTQIEIKVTDSDGAPLPNSEVALVVVDEAVLALTGYRIADPIALIYTLRGAGVEDYRFHDYVQLSDPEGLPPSTPLEPLEVMESAQLSLMHESAAEPSSGIDGSAIQLRRAFDALALFEPALVTDTRGRVTVPIKVLDSLTRYRITAVAVDAERSYGRAESTITVRKLLMVKPVPPRFLNFGDEIELPIVLHNGGDTDMVVDVALRTSNLTVLGSEGKRVRVPAGDRVEVRFPVAAESAGTAHFQVAAAGRAVGGRERYQDGIEQDLPVYTPAASEAFATYGEVDQSGTILQAVTPPTEALPQFGGLDITISSTQLHALTDAVVYLVDYPFSCSEQIASRLLALAALEDVLEAFEVEGIPAYAELDALVTHDLETLMLRQRVDGQIGFWKRIEDLDWPYLTVHVMHSVARLERSAFDVPALLRNRGLTYLREIRSHIPADYSLESRCAILTYAAFVRELLGDSPIAQVRALVEETGVDGLPLEALGWLLPTFVSEGDASRVAAILRRLDNEVDETAAGAHFVTSYSDGAQVLLHSERRVDGILLEALVRVKPDSPLIPKLVRGLLDHRTAGAWASTQENVFVLLGLASYFRSFETLIPNFVANIWLGATFAGQHCFQGRTIERATLSVPMDFIQKGDRRKDLLLQKDGDGRLYYRLGLSYAPKSLELDALDCGFTVDRRYEAIDHPADVQRDESGAWRICAGSRVRVRISMVAEGRRYHVALVDHLPAGLEPLNPELQNAGTVSAHMRAEPSSNLGDWRLCRGNWYEHDQMRDERVEVFTALVSGGVYDYAYVARATTLGRFVAQPAKAEEMYHPETFGRSGTDRVVVVDRSWPFQPGTT